MCCSLTGLGDQAEASEDVSACGGVSGAVCFVLRAAFLLKCGIVFVVQEAGCKAVVIVRRHASLRLLVESASVLPFGAVEGSEEERAKEETEG